MLVHILHSLVLAAILRGPSVRGGACTPQTGTVMLGSIMLAYMLHTLVFAAILRGPSERGGVCTPQEGAAMLVDILQAKRRRFHVATPEG